MPKGRYKQVFIVGLHRAGTSEMFHVLHHVLEYPGVIEGHLWPSFDAFARQVDSSVSQIGGLDSASYKAFLIGKVGADVMKDQVFNTIRRHYEQQFGESWVDKTPGIDMVRICPSSCRAFFR